MVNIWIKEYKQFIIKLMFLESFIKKIKSILNVDNNRNQNNNINIPDDFIDAGNSIKINFDKDKFRKFFLEEFQMGYYDINIIIKNTLAKLISNELKNINIDFSKFQISDFIPNTYEMGQTPSYKDCLEKGYFINCIRFSFNNKKIPISKIAINSPYFYRYYEAYDFIKIKMTPKNTKCKVQITNGLLNKDLFNGLIKIEDCNCSHLILYKHTYNLPLTFICPICGKLYLCECQKEYYKIIYKDYKRKLNRKDIITYGGSGTMVHEFVEIYEQAYFKNKICFICKNQVPPPIFSGESEFSSRYAPYIDTLFNSYYDGSCMNDTYTASKDTPDKIKENKKKAENTIRLIVGYPLIGEKWINETTLYKICCTLFPNCNILREYSPSWLEKQRIDIFIQEYNLAIEYQGEQHFKAIKHFGGPEGLEKTQERDQKKAKLCKQNGVALIYFNFDEELTEETVIRKIKNKLKNDKL